MTAALILALVCAALLVIVLVCLGVAIFEAKKDDRSAHVESGGSHLR